MSVFPSDPDAVLGQLDTPFESTGTVPTRATVKMDTREIYSKILDLAHSAVDILLASHIVSELYCESCGQIVFWVFLYGNPP